MAYRYGGRKRRFSMRRTFGRRLRRAKVVARKTARRVYRGTRKKSKRSVRKILANFAGKVAYKKMKSKRR